MATGLIQSSASPNEQDDPTSAPENDVGSPPSGDGTFSPDEPSPKRSRRSMEKKVISVPIGDADGSRNKGEVYPPQDSWAWRKYGQKPIKGSPYPRGYYRCSSTKGCPARKQVERSRHDPTMLLVTYSFHHNHPPLPPSSRTHHHHHHSSSSAVAVAPSSPKAPSTDNASASSDATDSPSPDEFALFPGEFAFFPSGLHWFSDMGCTATSTSTLESHGSFVGSTWTDSDVGLMLPVGEEDQTLYGDLGELPECSVVFRRCSLGEGLLEETNGK